MTSDARIDAYIANAAPFAQPILTHLRAMVHAACPDVEETWKWSFPHFMYQGAILCSMAAFKHHAVFGFWKAALIPDPDGILSVEGRESMGHMGKLTSLADLPKDAVLKKYIQAAMKLNEAGVKLPSRTKSGKPARVLPVPDYFTAVLQQNKTAADYWGSLSQSHRNEYVEWITEAKTEATRNKRMAQAVDMLAEGKSRNWKYS